MREGLVVSVVLLFGCVQNSTTVLPSGASTPGVLTPGGPDTVRVQIEPPQFNVINGDRFIAEVLAFTSQGQLTTAAYSVSAFISGSCAMIDSHDGRHVNLKAKEPGACTIIASVIVSANQVAGTGTAAINVRAAD